MKQKAIQTIKPTLEAVQDQFRIWRKTRKKRILSRPPNFGPGFMLILLRGDLRGDFLQKLTKICKSNFQ